MRTKRGFVSFSGYRTVDAGFYLLLGGMFVWANPELYEWVHENARRGR